MLFLLHVKKKKSPVEDLTTVGSSHTETHFIDVYLIGDFSGVFTDDFTVSGLLHVFYLKKTLDCYEGIILILFLLF